MQTTQLQTPSSEISPHIHWGHFGIIMAAIILLVGMTWLSKPELFSFNNQTQINPNAPHYYAYVTPADDLPKPEVLGASTDEGPSIINEDGTVSPIDTSGQVLGANTQDPAVTLSSINVITVPDSTAAIKKYLADDRAIETSPIEDGDFENALSSNDQNLLDKEVAKLTPIKDALLKISVPAGFVNLHKFKIIQYNSAIALLQSYGQMTQNPQLVGEDLQNYIQSQQQLADEISSVAQKYNIDPNSIGPAGEAAVLTGAVSGASQGAVQAAATLDQQASSTTASSLANQEDVAGQDSSLGNGN